MTREAYSMVMSVSSSMRTYTPSCHESNKGSKYVTTTGKTWCANCNSFIRAWVITLRHDIT